MLTRVHRSRDRVAGKYVAGSRVLILRSARRIYLECVVRSFARILSAIFACRAAESFVREPDPLGDEMEPGWIPNVCLFCRDEQSGPASPNRECITKPCPCPQPRFRVPGDVGRGFVTGACRSGGTAVAICEHDAACDRARSSGHALAVVWSPFRHTRRMQVTSPWSSRAYRT